MQQSNWRREASLWQTTQAKKLMHALGLLVVTIENRSHEGTLPLAKLFGSYL
jgi:uncharacterized membrane protein YgdD (TMEM256/DUF423 family)